MTTRRRTLLTFTAAALFALFLPALTASAQGIDPWWGRGSNQRNDRYGRGNYNERQMRDLARRIDDRSRELQRDVDRLLDHSRYDGTRREDRVNNDVRDFRNAAARFRDSIGNGRNLNQSADEARTLLQLGQRVSRYLSRINTDSRTASDWGQIRSDLNTVADIYNFRFRDDGVYNGGYGNDRRNNNDRGWRWPF